MKIRAGQLGDHLGRGLKRAYLVCGDEPFQRIEAADAIRRAARERGFGERRVLEVLPGFDWSELAVASRNMSLFSERVLLDLRLPGGKPGKEGAAALAGWCRAAGEDTLLLVTAPRLDGRMMGAAWVKALERVGAIVQVWPLTGGELTGWIRQRFSLREIEPGAGVVEMLAARVEGNLLAADQEVEKLRLLHGAGPLDAESMDRAVSDSARFDVFGLVDAALGSHGARSVRILDHLRAEGTAPTLVLWALTDTVRALASGDGARRGRMPPRRAQLLRRRQSQHGGASWEALLRQCAGADRVIKRRGEAEAWQELLQLTLLLCGENPLARAG